jgi:hypothetical protein
MVKWLMAQQRALELTTVVRIYYLPSSFLKGTSHNLL